MSLRVIFMGTPEFAVPTLAEILGAGHQVVAAYTQPARSAGRGIVDEKPIAVEPFAIDLLLPEGTKAVDVESMTPEDPEPATVKFDTANGRLRFQSPGFLVYRVVRIRLQAQ